jgi:hypothetical protein
MGLLPARRSALRFWIRFFDAMVCGRAFTVLPPVSALRGLSSRCKQHDQDSDPGHISPGGLLDNLPIRETV